MCVYIELHRGSLRMLYLYSVLVDLEPRYLTDKGSSIWSQQRKELHKAARPVIIVSSGV